MKLALCLYHYFPFGGLQRDFLRIARTCLQRGHQVDVYTSAWEGDREKNLTINFVPTSGWQNHTRLKSFSKHIQKLKQQSYDLVIGFNKMPGLDIYYAADVCYQSRIKQQRSIWYRLLPRYRQYLVNEKSVFLPHHTTKILVLAAQQRDEYHACYQTPFNRFHLLPPGITPDRIAPENANAIRTELRENHNLDSDDKVLLIVGSGFKTKGLDRVMHGFAALSAKIKNKSHLWIIGQDNPAAFLRLAKRLGILNQVTFFGPRHDLVRYYLAADLLVHPAYHENTGTVLLEAMVAGLPVLTVDACGYAHYVSDAKAGIVLSSPFDQAEFNRTMGNMLTSPSRKQWQNNGLAFGKTADIFSLPERAVSFFENCKDYSRDDIQK